jgi:hypothetical protein
VSFLGFGKDEIGIVGVPGEQTLSLPAGKIEVRYVEDRKRRSVGTDGGRRWHGPEPDLTVSVTPIGGAPLAIKPPRMISEGSGRTIHRKLGDVELPAEAECTVVAAMTVTEQQFSPRIVLRA